MRHTATIKLQLYTERQTDRKTDKQTDRQTDRQIRLKRDISQKRKKKV